MKASDRPLDIDFWEHIFQGDIQSSNSLTLLGNFELTKREQQFIIQGAWNKIAAAPGGAWLFSHFAKSPVSGGAYFLSIVPHGNITVFDNNRWVWVTNSIWPDWIGLSSAGQGAQTSVLLRTRAANYSWASYLSFQTFPIW